MGQFEFFFSMIYIIRKIKNTHRFVNLKKIHTQVWAKVNVPVDKNIKELVEALSAFPKLQTIESCQEIAQDKAYVCFYYGDYWNHQWNELTDFVLNFLGPRIVNNLGDNVDITKAVKIILTFSLARNNSSGELAS